MSDRTITENQAQWLATQSRIWEAEGIIPAETGERIRGRYTATQRGSLTSLVVFLGSAFVVIGLIWLVASNLERLTPSVRVLLVSAIWLSLMVVAEVLAARSLRGRVSGVWVGAARILAMGAYGATVFQVAQVLQVPADSPHLVGAWATGALLYAYVTDSYAVLVPAIPLAVFWFVWLVMNHRESPLSMSVALAVAGVAGVGLAAAHARGPTRLAWSTPWLEFGLAATLLGVFVSALPQDRDRAPWSVLLGALVVTGVLVAAASAATRSKALRVSALASGGGLVLSAALGSWASPSWGELPSGMALVRSVLAVLGFLLLATGVAVVGVLRESPRLTLLATLGLTVFVTAQASLVFAQLLSGAALFLAVGVVLLVTGMLADRGRRRLAQEKEELQ